MTKKALFLSGGWEGHEPQETSEFISSELQQFKIQSEIVNDLDVLGDIDFLKNFDIIIPVWTMGKIDDDNWEIKNSKIGNLQEVIHAGIGLAGWHGGMADAFRDNLKYQFLVGGIFLSHPGGFIDFEVNIADSKDPITHGIKDFLLKNTEQYYMLVDPNIKVLATTTFNQESYPLYEWRDDKMIESKDKKLTWITGNQMPVVWKKNYGKGRVFYSSIGHFLRDFQVPEAFEIQKRGIRWAAQGRQK